MITPIDPAVDKYPNSGALICYGSTIIRDFLGNAGNALTHDTYQKWIVSPSAVSAELILSESNPDYIAIGGLLVTGTDDKVSITVNTYDFGGSVNSTPYSGLTSSGNIIIPINAPTPVDYIDLVVSAYDGIDVSIARIQAGTALRMPQPIYGGHSPAELSSKVTYTNAKSMNGNFIGRTIERQGGATSFKWRNLDPDWYRSTFQPFVQSAKTKPFFIEWRPDYHSGEVSYCWTNKDIKPVNQGGATTLMSVTMSVECFGNGI